MNNLLCSLATLFCLGLPAFLFAQDEEGNFVDSAYHALTVKWQGLSLAGKDDSALVYAREAYEKALREFGTESPEYGNSLDILGYSLHHTGQYEKAEKCFAEAVAHGLIYLGEDNEDYIGRLSNYAMLHMDTWEIARAVSELEIVVQLAEKNLESDNPYKGILVNNLGLAYEKMGYYDRALERYLYALELTEISGGKETVRYATRLCNIAAVYRKTNKAALALEYIHRAIPIIEKTVGKSQSIYGSALNGLLMSYTQMKRYDEGLKVSEELLATIERLPIKETVATYDFLASVAYFYYEAGLYERCAEFSKGVLQKNLPLFPRQFTEHASVARIAMASLEKTGRLKEAAEYALLHNRFALEELRENLSSFSEDEQLHLYQTYYQWSDVHSQLFAVRHPEFRELAEAVYNYQMTVKGSSLYNHRLLLQSLRNQPNTQLGDQFEEWQHLQREISKQYALPPSRRQARPDSLLSLANELERNLVFGSETFRLNNQMPGWQEIQSALLSHEAAIEFSRLYDQKTDSALYVAWILRPSGAPRMVRLFEEKEVGNLQATRRLYAPETAPGETNLKQLVWEPLQPFLKEVSTIYFAPAGILHQISLGSVPISETEVLADRFKLHRLVSTRQLLSAQKIPPFKTPTAALVFGGIRYEADSLALSTTNALVEKEATQRAQNSNRAFSPGEDWDFLKGSAEEAAFARDRLDASGAKVIYANGFNASEGLFKKSAQGLASPDILHLSTHGFFLTKRNAEARSGFEAAENPMARAGLVLAGGNRAWGGNEPLNGQEDGILTALEISRLDLSGTELAILSACGTGQGEIEAGEGVLGLQRAFKMAGVRYVIMTLWNIQDHDAQQFMGLFYEAWLGQKKTIPDAFREAQQQMHHLHTKPFQPVAWAGFVLLE